jgi:hypothetical protein
LRYADISCPWSHRRFSPIRWLRHPAPTGTALAGESSGGNYTHVTTTLHSLAVARLDRRHAARCARPGCSSTKTASTGQLIRCSDHGVGPVDCHPIASLDSGSAAGSGSDTCEDVDDDGDGTAHDEGQDAHDGMHDGVTDRDHDGTSDSADDDDDGDGIPDARDCDKRHRGDDDGDDDGGSGDDGSSLT